MQYQVPQFIELEDKIIGPLTLKQFLYLAFAGAVLFVLWFLLQFFVWIIIAVPVAALAAAFAFIKINDRPFIYFFFAFWGYFMKPKLYLFSTTTTAGASRPAEQKPATAPLSAPAAEERVTRSKLKELALNLDTGTGRLNQ